MRRDLISKAGVAAVVILAPGGFILGLALLAKRYRSPPSSASALSDEQGDAQSA